ncbi:hypothetical protein ACFWNK_38460 [Streptomyces sp. NPDC058417]|uniref:hypothetical protein n=1 Tax=unclassified Streptomyces TaxID=2593676 RepID=UPI0036463854
MIEQDIEVLKSTLRRYGRYREFDSAGVISAHGINISASDVDRFILEAEKEGLITRCPLWGEGPARYLATDSAVNAHQSIIDKYGLMGDFADPSREKSRIEAQFPAFTRPLVCAFQYNPEDPSKSTYKTFQRNSIRERYSGMQEFADARWKDWLETSLRALRNEPQKRIPAEWRDGADAYELGKKVVSSEIIRRFPHDVAYIIQKDYWLKGFPEDLQALQQTAVAFAQKIIAYKSLNNAVRGFLDRYPAQGDEVLEKDISLQDARARFMVLNSLVAGVDISSIGRNTGILPREAAEGYLFDRLDITIPRSAGLSDLTVSIVEKSRAAAPGWPESDQNMRCIMSPLVTENERKSLIVEMNAAFSELPYEERNAVREWQQARNADPLVWSMPAWNPPSEQSIAASLRPVGYSASASSSTTNESIRTSTHSGQVARPAAPGR